MQLVTIMTCPKIYSRLSGYLVSFLMLAMLANAACSRDDLVTRKDKPMTNKSLVVNFSSPEKPALLHSPVAAIVSVKNVTGQPVEILLPYPNPNHLSFKCKAADFAKPKEVQHEDIERTIPIAISPEKTYTAIYYLNRYFQFQKTGQARVNYRLETTIKLDPRTEKSTIQQAVFEGEFGIKLIEANEKELREDLAAYANKLASRDRQEKMQAAEALAYLDTPVCVEYVARMLSIDNLEVIGIRALGRFPSAQTDKLILGTFSHKDSAVVGAALHELDRGKRPLPRASVQHLLTSENPNSRWLALDWLAAHPDERDRPLLVPLLVDRNAQVREQAKAYADKLKKP